MDGWGGERQIGEDLSLIDERHKQRYNFARDYCNNKNVLDIACGCGYGSYILSEQASKVTGLDCSEEAIDYANKYYSSQNSSFHQFNLLEDDCKHLLNKFDIVVSFETIEHLDLEVFSTCRKLLSFLKTDGLLICSHPHMQQPKQAGFHKQFNINGEDLKAKIIEDGNEIIKSDYLPNKKPGAYKNHIFITKNKGT